MRKAKQSHTAGSPVLTVLAANRQFVTRGKLSKTLQALVRAQGAGISGLDQGRWANRLAAYVYVLRRKHLLEIETVRYRREGGWHGRYVLKTDLTIKKWSCHDKPEQKPDKGRGKDQGLTNAKKN